jgi:hypothetical protein
MDNNKIPITETATFFPNYTSIDNIVLNGDMRSFDSFSGNDKYVFYSNVYNLSDSDIEQLSINYFILKTFKKGKVRIEILKRK